MPLLTNGKNIMILPLKQIKIYWRYDLKNAREKSVIVVLVAFEGDQTDLKNSSSHKIIAQGAPLGAIETLVFLVPRKIGSFHTLFTVMVGASLFFLRAGRPVFLHKKEKKIIVPLSSAVLCVLFDRFPTCFALVLRI